MRVSFSRGGFEGFGSGGAATSRDDTGLPENASAARSSSGGAGFPAAAARAIST